MRTIGLEATVVHAASVEAVEILEAGGVVLFPTDTLYGLGADAFSNDAVDAVYAIKGRDEGKPIHALVSDITMAGMFADISDDARLLSERLPKGKVTFICTKKRGFDTGIGRGIGTFGFRIPDNELCKEILRAFGRPITATSANRAGDTPQRSVEKILEQLGNAGSGISLVIDGGELAASEPSTVVDLSGTRPVIVREGAVPAALVWEALGTE